jgi:hypothetical protein
MTIPSAGDEARYQIEVAAGRLGDTDRLANARAQGQAQFDSIVEMVEALMQSVHHDATEEDHDAAEQAIHADALSVEVRSGWYELGGVHLGGDNRPVEYRILLCTGGPAVQIRGTLSEHGEPETARLQVQDWFTPWTLFFPIIKSAEHAHPDVEEILLAYARCFYFGE